MSRRRRVNRSKRQQAERKVLALENLRVQRASYHQQGLTVPKHIAGEIKALLEQGVE